MNNPAFTGLAITLHVSPFCDAPGWIARLKHYPHIQGMGKEPEDALRDLRETWDSLFKRAQDDSFNLRKYGESLEDTLMGKYESLQEAIADAEASPWGDGIAWYVTHQNKLMAHMFSHFVGVKAE